MREQMHYDASEWNVLARYVLGECSAEEAESVRQWIAAEPRRGAEVELMQRVGAFARELPPAEAIDAMWARMAVALDPVPAAAGRRAPRRWRWTTPVAAAAALALAIAGGSAVWPRLSNLSDAPTPEVAAREFRTVRGQRALMTLLDGTRVVLAPGSAMHVAIGESGRREVVLEGEAVFEVIHDSTRPFIVRAGDAVTEDLGTRFGVRAYRGEPVRVVVTEGTVAVRDTSSHASVAVLEARDLAWVNGPAGVTVERAVDAESYLSWTTGRLVFQRAPLAEVVQQLERWFDVQVVVRDSSLLATSVNLSFDNDDLDYVLHALALSLDVRVERHGRLIYLRDQD